MPNYLTSLLLVPLAGVVGVLVTPARLTELLRVVANVAAVALFLAAVPLWWTVNVGPGGAPFQLVERHLQAPGLGAAYVIGVDGFSALLILLMALAAALAVWSLPRPQLQGSPKSIYVGLLVLEVGLLGLFTALDMLLFFLSWLVVLAASVWLVRTEPDGERMSRRLLLWGGAASLLTLAGLLALYEFQQRTTGIYSFDVTAFQPLNAAPGTQAWILAALVLGFMLPSWLFPLFLWPGSKPGASTALGAVLAAGALSAGLCGLLRFALPFLPAAVKDYAPSIGLLCSIAVVGWAVAAFFQKEWKRILATAVGSQTTMVLLALFALNPVSVTGSLLQTINVGLCTAALILVVGMVDSRRQVSGLAPLGRRSAFPLLAIGFLVLVLASIGLPSLNTFIGARLIVRGLWRHDAIWTGAVVVAMALLAVRLLSAYRRAVLTVGSGSVPNDLTYREMTALLPVMGIAFWIGVHPEPFIARLTPSVNRVVLRVSPEFAAECDTTLTPEILSSSPGAQFLAAAPCGPDGAPLPEAAPDAPR